MKETVIRSLPPGHPWGQSVQYYHTLDSTNTQAKLQARAGAPEGTVLIAGAQTGGRGRLGRQFSSPEGLGLYLSLILRPNCDPSDLMHLTCAAGVATAEAVAAATGLQPGIKWTNDLVIGTRKLGGILTELGLDPATGKVDFAVIGIGINCLQTETDFPSELQNMACSLKMHTPVPCTPAMLAPKLIDALYRMNSRLFFEKAAIMAAFRGSCITLGKEISILKGDSIRRGTASGIDDSGGLLVTFSDGTVETVASGEVSIRGMYGYV